MIRWSLLLSLAMILTAGAAAQEKQLRDPDKKPDEPKKLAPDKKPDADKPKPPGSGDDEEAKILERLTRNSKSAEERLGKPDTGDETRKLQDDVLKDIDELIKRLKNPPPPPQQDQNQNEPMGGGGSGSKGEQAKGSPAEQGGNEQGFKRQSGLTREQRRQQREQRRQQQSRQRGGQPMANGGQQPQPGKNPGGQQPMGGNQQAKKNGGEGGPGGNSAGTEGGGGGRDPKGANAAAEMYKDVWGHLPEKMRQEMDSYFKEKFMPKYNDLLKQYYSNIAEQNKKK